MQSISPIHAVVLSSLLAVPYYGHALDLLIVGMLVVVPEFVVDLVDVSLTNFDLASGSVTGLYLGDDGSHARAPSGVDLPDFVAQALLLSHQLVPSHPSALRRDNLDSGPPIRGGFLPDGSWDFESGGCHVVARCRMYTHRYDRQKTACASGGHGRMDCLVYQPHSQQQYET